MAVTMFAESAMKCISNFFRSLAMTILAVGWLAVPVSAQPFYLWTFAELDDKSDVVVIASWVGTTDTGIKTEITDLSPGLPVVEMNAEFKVLLIFKGTVPSGPVTLLHYRLDPDRMGGGGGCGNCGTQLDFSKGPSVYLLFLKHDPDNRYQPTSGQVFPDHSVMALPKNGVTMRPQ
jgi:hypothetical protein